MFVTRARAYHHHRRVAHAMPAVGGLAVLIMLCFNILMYIWNGPGGYAKTGAYHRRSREGGCCSLS